MTQQHGIILFLIIYFYLRSLRPGGVLLKLTVMNGEVRPEITAVTQRSNAAAEGEKKKKNIKKIF